MYIIAPFIAVYTLLSPVGQAGSYSSYEDTTAVNDAIYFQHIFPLHYNQVSQVPKGSSKK